MSSQKKFIWDEWNKEHIKKHFVTVQEVEEVFKSFTIQKQSYMDRTLILGESAQGRLLTVVCSQELQDDFYVVSARDMSKKERILYYEKIKTNKTF